MPKNMFTKPIKQAAARALTGIGAASAVAGLWLVPCGPVGAEGAAAGEPIIVEQQVEDSVLIATRKALDGGEEYPEGSLEPISQTTEQEPEPADPPNTHAPPVDGSTASDTVEVSDMPAPRVASRVLTPQAGDVATAFLQEDLKVSAAPFKGIIAGQSTKQELVSLWGQPTAIHKTPTGEVYTYDQERFAAIEVLVQDGQVELIKAELEKQSQPGRLAAKLRVDSFDSVMIRDEATAENLGVAYPEKGLLLMLSKPPKGVTPITPQFVTHLVLQAPDAEAFALRAETRPEHAFGDRLADLDQALATDPNNAYSLWLRSGLYLSTGQPVKAEADASKAIKQESENTAYRLRWCEALAGIGRYDDAVLETRKVIDNEATPRLVKAQALALMGRLASLGDSDIAEKAIGFHTTAISVADSIATSKNDAQRRAAKRLLIDSHLAVAIEVSRRSYDDKAEVVAQWIGRASGLAEESITNEQASLLLRLRVARKALEALANFKPTKDPGPWIKEASEAAAGLIAATDDELQKHQAHWELGQAYFHALRVAHSRREADRGIAYGEKAIDHLAYGAVSGDARPQAEHLVGRLYFHLGAAHAVHKQDHQSAVEWYDRAEKLLTAEAPKSELVAPRQLGEALVSMGVSYWDQDQQARAMELTLRGARIMEQAVKAGVLDQGAMAVPYGNLSTMHSKQDNAEQAVKYAELASQARAAKSRSVATQPRNKTPKRSAQKQPSNRTAKRSVRPTQDRVSQAQQQKQKRPSGKYSNRKGMLR